MVVATRRSSLRTSSPLQSSSSSAAAAAAASSSSVKQELQVREKQDRILANRDLLASKQEKDLSDERPEAPNLFPPTLQNDRHGKAGSDKLQIPPFLPLASPYESLRLQRIAENKARLAALGVQKHAENLTSCFSASMKTGKRPWKKSPIPPIELRRRSERLKNNPPSLESRRRSERLKNTSRSSGFGSRSCPYRHSNAINESPQLQLTTKRKVSRNYDRKTQVKPAKASIPKYVPTDERKGLSALRCHSKGSGSLRDPVVGICCHSCREKKLCGEPDCERCRHRDVTKDCVGKTKCSRCHSSTGIFCRACLKIRYGEEMEEVRKKVDWMCPHCVEKEGSHPYWICNSSICLAKRKVAPTGIVIFKARELGYESVAHYLADVLRKQESSS